jgi:hypothetical protein
MIPTTPLVERAEKHEALILSLQKEIAVLYDRFDQLEAIVVGAPTVAEGSPE